MKQVAVAYLLVAALTMAVQPVQAKDAIFGKDLCELSADDVTDTAQCTRWAVVCYPSKASAEKSAEMSQNVFAQRMAFNWAAHNCRSFDPAQAKAYFDTVNSWGK